MESGPPKTNPAKIRQSSTKGPTRRNKVTLWSKEVRWDPKKEEQGGKLVQTRCPRPSNHTCGNPPWIYPQPPKTRSMKREVDLRVTKHCQVKMEGRFRTGKALEVARLEFQTKIRGNCWEKPPNLATKLTMWQDLQNKVKAKIRNCLNEIQTGQMRSTQTFKRATDSQTAIMTIRKKVTPRKHLEEKV